MKKAIAWMIVSLVLSGILVFLSVIIFHLWKDFAIFFGGCAITGIVMWAFRYVDKN